MRTSLFTWGAALTLSFSAFLTPLTANAAKDCTIGSGFYSCDFKDEEGVVSQGNLFLSTGVVNSTFDVYTGIEGDFGPCNCQLTGTVKDNDKPPKDNTSIICAGNNWQTSLVGKISGNPTKLETLKVKGQAHFFNGTGSYLFDCRANTNTSALQ